ncbi:hypothetical protein DPEC_G00136880 [Dallia pectoralis]|uniref:Uncharacterized protein n=1 Tax=Dallia pectoralis TaxID=75939 RepID=A0ACC2GLG7_DALPE|nr:hypothetical protein DPEC_G00136880 [Dallia pectoralis]
MLPAAGPEERLHLGDERESKRAAKVIPNGKATLTDNGTGCYQLWQKEYPSHKKIDTHRSLLHLTKSSVFDTERCHVLSEKLHPNAHYLSSGPRVRLCTTKITHHGKGIACQLDRGPPPSRGELTTHIRDGSFHGNYHGHCCFKPRLTEAEGGRGIPKICSSKRPRDICFIYGRIPMKTPLHRSAQITLL